MVEACTWADRMFDDNDIYHTSKVSCLLYLVFSSS